VSNPEVGKNHGEHLSLFKNLEKLPKSLINNYISCALPSYTFPSAGLGPGKSRIRKSSLTENTFGKLSSWSSHTETCSGEHLGSGLYSFKQLKKEVIFKNLASNLIPSSAEILIASNEIIFLIPG